VKSRLTIPKSRPSSRHPEEKLPWRSRRKSRPPAIRRREKKTASGMRLSAHGLCIRRDFRRIETSFSTAKILPTGVLLPARKRRPFMVISSTIFRRVVLLLALTFSSGCASTRIVNEWREPDYIPPAFKKVVVLGIAKEAVLRRSFEDEFVAQLKANGIDAAPGYQFIPEDGQAAEARLLNAVKQTGADAAIMTRLVRIEHRTQITPGYYNAYPVHGFYRWYSWGWTGFYEPPRVYNYDVYTSETSLYDLKQDRMVWAGTVQTTDPGNIRKEIKNYVQTVIEALKENNLLRKA
jgi:hypothetical protein